MLRTASKTRSSEPRVIRLCQCQRGRRCRCRAPVHGQRHLAVRPIRPCLAVSIRVKLTLAPPTLNGLGRRVSRRRRRATNWVRDSGSSVALFQTPSGITAGSPATVCSSPASSEAVDSPPVGVPVPRPGVAAAASSGFWCGPVGTPAVPRMRSRRQWTRRIAPRTKRAENPYAVGLTAPWPGERGLKNALCSMVPPDAAAGPPVAVPEDVGEGSGDAEEPDESRPRDSLSGGDRSAYSQRDCRPPTRPTYAPEASPWPSFGWFGK